ncbi:MAG: electron transfer flavoprotein subunit beta/FixA family protein [Flavobacteriales bacterium]|nr:electron transfer flavoprotein subunit beta/FixA family protein [Flavobacteriales bacterium]
MNILVCISKAPDTTTKIQFVDNNTRLDGNNVQYIVNPYDEWFALVRALELTEAGGGQVTIINVGKAENDPVIRKALAIGAHEAVRIDGDDQDGYYVAGQIAAYAKDKNFDLILLGKETIDFNGSMVGGMIAAMLDLPFVSLASKLDVNGTSATISRDVKGGVEVLECATPMVISCAKGMAEARIPNMRGIMAARSKPLNVVPPVADISPLATVQSYATPPQKTACKMIDAENAGELINLLHNEAKVI